MPAIASGDPVVTHQRGRILAAATEVFAQQGLDRTAVEDIIRPAGVSRRTFYDLFESKVDVFRVAYAHALELLDDQVSLAFAGEENWPKGVAAAVAALVEWAESQRSSALLLVTGPKIAGRQAADCHDQLVRRFAPRSHGGQKKVISANSR